MYRTLRALHKWVGLWTLAFNLISLFVGSFAIITLAINLAT